MSLISTARHTAAALREAAARLAAPGADPLAAARQLAALAGGLEAAIHQAETAARTPLPARPALRGTDRLWRE